MKNLIKYITLVVLLTACTKNNNKEVTVSGRLMQSCETPAANKNGIIHLSGGGLLNNPSTSLEFTTDENGFFKVTHDKSFSEFSVRTSANHSVLEASISEDEKELGEVYIFPPSARYYLKLEVIESFTENDTLVYYNRGWPQDGREKWLKLIGPFQSGFIDTVHYTSNINHLPINFSDMNNEALPKLGINYRIVNETTSDNPVKSVEIPTNYCQEDYQTVLLVID